MFSGLTNQVSSWMGGSGKKDVDPQKLEEEKLSSPVNEIGDIIEGEIKKDARYAVQSLGEACIMDFKAVLNKIKSLRSYFHQEY
uniref:Uncharacterized protein n=1 Tax=Timema genevievae TaxID=629358 RepID=A0A7R9JUX8_TIMGE|nr:unnamed protein product [Timema genevievae]